MRSSRLAFTCGLLLVAFVIPANSCGPFFPEAVFVQNTAPDGPYTAYAKGELGVPQPGYRVQDLVIAYDWLDGHGLTPGEQQQAVALDTIRTTRGDDDPAKLPGFRAWRAARKNTGVPEGSPDKPAPGGLSTDLNGDRPVPGESFQSFTNCLDAAFATAAETLNARKATHAADAPSLTDWVHGQDAVFANCNGAADAMPADTAAAAPLWLKQDRAYQQAAAKFYQTDYDAALVRLKAIADDGTSPWHEIAPLVAARAMIRRATIGQITELPSAAQAPPGAPYSDAREKAQQQYSLLVKQRRPARLAEARTHLQAIIADPALDTDHACAARLLDFVNLRLDPARQAEVLVTRLAASDRPQSPGRFEQALIDLRYYLYPPDADHATGTATHSEAAIPLLEWMQTMRAPAPVERTDMDSRDSAEAATTQQQRTQAAAEALSRWRITHTTSWLVSALANVHAADAVAPELIRAANEVAQGSPAWTSATYQRLRLMPDATAMRGDLAALQPSLMRAPQRSTINLFRILRQRSSPTLSDFLRDSAALPAGVTLDTDDPEPPTTTANPNGLCGVHSSQAATLLFDPTAATVLNTRMPLTLLADAAEDKALPRNLGFQVAQSAWTRAVLLGRPEIAHRMTPLLVGCYPAWKQWLDDYDSASTQDNRRIAGLLALMRFASTEPVVRTGIEREEGFATYSDLRDNWWPAATTASAPDTAAPMFFGSTPLPKSELPDPPFLGASDRAAAEREVAALRNIPCASDYFAAAALDWQQQHPQDARNDTLLGFAERVVRNGCRTDATKELNHRLFVVVQAKYPQSEWAKRYTTWE